MKTTRTTKQIMKTAAYKNAAAAVSDYAARYVRARGHYPTISVAMMPDLRGWPVRNPMGGAAIAYFATADVAGAAVAAAYREHREYAMSLSDAV